MGVLGRIGEVLVYFGALGLLATGFFKFGEWFHDRREARAERARKRRVLRNQAWLDVMKEEA